MIRDFRLTFRKKITVLRRREKCKLIEFTANEVQTVLVIPACVDCVTRVFPVSTHALLLERITVTIKLFERRIVENPSRSCFENFVSAFPFNKCFARSIVR